ncbi:terpene cyclase/mutase family protein [Streptomyces sp. NPDC051554]|uniref:terpene cyclase/mutase family protein n=1 Tax=Streptomyces sp. NPDC051554 TaxID=3365656 RepID=UPI00379E5E8D
MAKVDEPLREAVLTAITVGAENLARLQEKDGSWHGDYGGPTFLLPVYIALRHISGTPIDSDRASRMRDHLVSTINEDDGIGLYTGGPSAVFPSSLGYVALRLLGEEPTASHMSRLRRWIHRQGTPLRSASWGKIILCLLGLYEYAGIHPLTPEMWLLPRWAPMHPRRLWCHARQVYLPMAWLYGRRAAMPADDLIRQLRTELYTEPYECVDWAGHRSTVAPSDEYRPLTGEFRLVSKLLAAWEHAAPGRLRARALARLEEHIDYEDRVTGNLRIGPINAVLNTLVQHFRDPAGDAFQRGMAGLEHYLWDRETHIGMQGYNSSQLWDTAFAVQALDAVHRATGAPPRTGPMTAALGFVHDQQILIDDPGRARYFRDPSQGGWPFSTRPHGWPISDCTAEALKAALLGNDMGAGSPLEQGRIDDAVRLLLGWQNPDGGWPTYERARAGRWLERFNPSQVFGDIMVDYSYVECTGSVLQALAAFRPRASGDALLPAVDRALKTGRDFLLRAQREDGGFEGSWGVCFTYGTWFGIRGLLAAGVPRTDRSIQAACSFLLSIQHADGSWGESPESCPKRSYVPSSEGKVVMTAWALLALTHAGRAGDPACERAVRFLMDRQRDDGGFAREGFAGVFNRTAMINYDSYRHYFPIWALAEWLTAAGDPAIRGRLSARVADA